nr:MAG TPA: hypothetical protein [Caudoviricetes sp.]
MIFFLSSRGAPKFSPVFVCHSPLCCVLYFTIVLRSVLRAVLLVRVCSCSFVRPE